MTPRTWGEPLVVTALIVGVLDISYAIVFSYLRSGTSPSRLLQSVASGALGRDAFSGGAATAALGPGFHFLIAFIITAIFFGVAVRVPALTGRPVLVGALYGVVVYAVMNFVVIPRRRSALVRFREDRPRHRRAGAHVPDRRADRVRREPHVSRIQEPAVIE